MLEGHYRLEIVGGPFDGVRGFSWRVCDEFPLPTSIRVGTCSGHGECNARDCAGGGRRHASFWHPDVEDPPVRTVTYVLQDETVDEPAGDRDGKARYALGGLDLGQHREALEMVPAGAEGGVCFG